MQFSSNFNWIDVIVRCTSTSNPLGSGVKILSIPDLIDLVSYYGFMRCKKFCKISNEKKGQLLYGPGGKLLSFTIAPWSSSWSRWAARRSTIARGKSTWVRTITFLAQNTMQKYKQNTIKNKAQTQFQVTLQQKRNCVIARNTRCKLWQIWKQCKHKTHSVHTANYTKGPNVCWQ